MTAEARPVQGSRASSNNDDAQGLGDLSPQQWKSGIAAWLGWTFDGLDQHLFTLVYAPFVVQLLGAASSTDPRVGRYASIIQGCFLFGWATGGAFFGRLGDRLGRSRTLALTVLTYAAFTGLSCLAQTWWQLAICRFLAALGIGGEWAVGASLIAETWPRRWRPWLAAILQTGVNFGVLMAVLAGYLMSSIIATQPRWLFVVGVLPALMVFWIRRAVPETEEWHDAKTSARGAEPRIRELFQGSVRRTTLTVVLICACALTAHWAFSFWNQLQFRNLPDVITQSPAQKASWALKVLFLLMVANIVGNFFAGALARWLGFRMAITVMCLGYLSSLILAYGIPHPYRDQYWLLAAPGFFGGLFAIFTMYLPPLFPTLLRTTGAGFCYNVGRVVSAFGVVFFGLFQKVGDYRLTLLYASCLFVPAGIAALFLPDVSDGPSPPFGEVAT